MTISILQRPEAYIIQYPQAVKFAEAQEDIFWTAKEISLEKDLNDLKNNMTEAELHGIMTVLKLFTLYEVRVGGEYWSDTIMKYFKRPEIQRMAASFSAIELNVHAPFYNKINELLGLNTEEFYTSYVNDDVLRTRMDAISNTLYIPDDIPDHFETELLKTIACFSILEGAVLYSSFAFLKHFQAEGKNKLMNLTAGINFSVRDENLHSLAGAWLFKEMEKDLSKRQTFVFPYKDILDFANEVVEHEDRIIDMIFEKGKIPGITEHQLKNFVRHRVDLCLQQLGLELTYRVEYDPVSKWFYKNINSAQLHDFFQKQGNAYSRDWSEDKFNWKLAEGA